MTTSVLIRALCKDQNVSIAELARRIGQSFVRSRQFCETR